MDAEAPARKGEAAGDEPFGRRLARLRCERRLSKRALAGLAGVPRSCVVRLESGAGGLSAATLAALAAALGVSLDLLMTGRESER